MATTTKKKSNALSPGLRDQREFLQSSTAEQFDYSLVVADAFVKGIRDIGYKSTATAIDELVDNSIQAGAKRIRVLFGLTGASTKPKKIAVIDDGHGMDAEMIRLAAVWGGTHRQGDRSGFGRYGFGLPSACMSQGKAFQIISRVEDEEFQSVSFSLDKLGSGDYNIDGQVMVPPTQAAELPDWVQRSLAENAPDLNPKTVVILDKLDNLTWTTANGLSKNLLEHFGITYRNYLRSIEIGVEGRAASPVDPLFLDPDARFYDLDSDRAESFEPIKFDVKNEDGTDGTVQVRFSLMPPTFQAKDKSKAAEGKNANARFPIMKDHNGIAVLRNGRQVDVVNTRCPWTTFTINDRNIGIEVDFSASLDEEFSVTTSKQQIGISSRMWDLMSKHGVYRAIQELRKKNKRERAKLKETEKDKDGKRDSEKVMEESTKFKSSTGNQSEEQAQEAEDNLNEEVRRRAEASGVDEDEVKSAVEEEAQNNPFKIEETELVEGPFYVVEQRGGQTVLVLNTAHRFYTDVYAARAADRWLRSGIELLLFTLGECELDASEDRRRFYKRERVEWSNRLDTQLDLLAQMRGPTEESDEGDDGVDEPVSEEVGAS